MNGVSLPIYDHETFGKAINAYAKDSNINLRNLSTYANELRGYEKVNEPRTEAFPIPKDGEGLLLSLTRTQFSLRLSQ